MLKTHSSSEMTEEGEKRRYRYFSVSARKKLCIMLSCTPVLTWEMRDQIVRYDWKDEEKEPFKNVWNTCPKKDLLA